MQQSMVKSPLVSYEYGTDYNVMETSTVLSVEDKDTDNIGYIGYAAPDVTPQPKNRSTKRKSSETTATDSSSKQQRMND